MTAYIARAALDVPCLYIQRIWHFPNAGLFGFGWHGLFVRYCINRPQIEQKVMRLFTLLHVVEPISVLGGHVQSRRCYMRPIKMGRRSYGTLCFPCLF